MVVEPVAWQVRLRNEAQQVLRRAIQLRRGNLARRERLSGLRIEWLEAGAGKIAVAFGERWHGRVLIKDVVRSIAGVIQLEVRSPAGVFVEARNSERAAKRRAECVLSKLRLRRRHTGIDLIRRCVERRASKRVRCRPLIRALPARGPAAEEEPTAPGARATPSSTKLTGCARTAEVASERLTRLRSEARRELSGCRIELPERDGLGAIVHQSAVEAGRVVTSGNGDGIGLRVLQRKARRQQSRRLSGVVLRDACERRFGVGVCLHLERLKSLSALAGPPTVAAAAASPHRRRRRSRRGALASAARDRRVAFNLRGRRGSSGFTWSRQHLAARPQRKLKVRCRVARWRTERDRALRRAEARQLRRQTIGSVGCEEDDELAVGIGGGRGLQDIARSCAVHNDGYAGQPVAAAGDVTLDAA